MLEPDGHIRFVAFGELLLAELGVKAVLILFWGLVWASTDADELCGAEWLQLFLDYVEPDHLHFDLGVVGDLPQDDLVAHMHRHENGRAKALGQIFSLVLFQLDHVHEVSLDLGKVKDLAFKVSPLDIFVLSFAIRLGANNLESI